MKFALLVALKMLKDLASVVVVLLVILYAGSGFYMSPKISAAIILTLIVGLALCVWVMHSINRVREGQRFCKANRGDSAEGVHGDSR